MVVLICVSLMINNVEHLFKLIGCFYISFGEMSIRLIFESGCFKP